VCGLPRKGKTAVAVLMALLTRSKGSMIYSNVEMHDGSGNDIRGPAGRLDPDDPKVCLQQLGDIFRAIYEDESWNQPRFLLLDEFSSIADSQNWKEF